MPGEDVLEAMLIALREAVEKSFSQIDKKLDEMSQDIIRVSSFEAWCKRVNKLEMSQDKHDVRLNKLERVNWLLGILGTLAMAVLAAIAIALATGKIAIVVR